MKWCACTNSGYQAFSSLFLRPRNSVLTRPFLCGAAPLGYCLVHQWHPLMHYLEV